MNILEKIFQAGVVGGGGAGFPTHIKLKTEVEYFIINGAECEPFLATDQYIMEHHATEVIKAMDVVATKLKARHAIIALKGKYGDEIKALKEAIELEKSAVEIFLLDNFYPVGDEQMAIYEVTGRSVTPGGIPSSTDTVVANVGTMLNVYEALNDQPVTYKYVSIVGDVKTPMVAKVPIGTAIDECVKLAGGSPLSSYNLIIGGPMMGRIIDKADSRDELVTKTVGGIIVVPENHYLVNMAKTSVEHIQNQAQSACIQCRFCTDLCPRFLIGHPLEPHKIMRKFGQKVEIDEEFEGAMLCCECGVCELFACPMHLAPRMVNVYIKGELRKKGIGYSYNGDKAQANPIREYRKVSPERLISRIDMTEYEVTKPRVYKEYVPDMVSIPLRQHIGKPASPIVSEGDIVKAGAPIATILEDEMGANIHASISGIVLKINENITIQKISEGVK